MASIPQLDEITADWLADVVDKMHNYWTKEYQQERQRILETRASLGLE